jgi:hypothetical protein
MLRFIMLNFRSVSIMTPIISTLSTMTIIIMTLNIMAHTKTVTNV